MAGDIQRLPAAGPERELLREKGQFWTPNWIAQAMVAYVLGAGSDHVFDPAVGAGAFFRAARVVADETGREVALLGTEVDPSALESARHEGLSAEDLAGVEIRDFVLDPPHRSFRALVANPPYIRHHRLSSAVKARLRSFCGALTGYTLDGRAGLHIYFLLRGLQLLEPGGRLAFIVPADTCEGVFAPVLWNWITSHYRLDGVVTFAPQASPFPNVDTNPVILMLRKAQPAEEVWWARCTRAESRALRTWMELDLGDSSHPDVETHRRDLRELLAAGLSRPPSDAGSQGAILGDFARVLRGIVTGANEFFFLTADRARELGLEPEFLKPAVGRTRDVKGEEITPETMAELDRSGRPTLFFAPDGQPMEAFPPAVRSYLEYGLELGLPARPLLATRRVWYKAEEREIPPIMFAYLGRRNARFVRNLAGVLPLTCFLAVYPRRPDPGFLDSLWSVLRHPDTVANLARVGKSYGSGAIKVEPRALERLPLPEGIVVEAGLRPVPTMVNLRLF